MRGAWVRFGAENKADVDLEISRWKPHSSIQEYMAEFFPWLDYKHTKPLLFPAGDTEGEIHELKVWLNDIGRSFLILEKFYEKGPPEKYYEVPFDTIEELDEDEQMEADYQRAMERD